MTLKSNICGCGSNHKRLVISLIFIMLSGFLTGRPLMANDDHKQYLSDAATVNKIYSWLQAGNIDEATRYLKGLGEDPVVVQAWINVQCDINNVKGDARLSATIGNRGVEFCLTRDLKLPAAMMLHNISAFLMPDFDENVAPEDLPTILEAAKRQVILRRTIKEKGPLMWALWDEGLAHLAAGNPEQAVVILTEGEELAQIMGDQNGAAWCQIFIGKARLKSRTTETGSAKQATLAAARIINETGEDWEKESVTKILNSINLTLDK